MTFETARQVFFDKFPDPMWVYDVESLRFLEVNQAAVEQYGYSRAEFLSMTIQEIRPEEDAAKLSQYISVRPADTSVEPKLWRHRIKNGDLIDVEITSHGFGEGRESVRLVRARNVTDLLEVERRKAALLQQEREIRERAEATAQYFQSLFEALPGKYLVLTAENYQIVAASQDYCDATLTVREEILGRRLFDVFPDNPEEPEADGVTNLRASLERVKRSGVPDVMPVQRYPILRPEEEGGGFEERYWDPVNKPVKSPDGRVIYIIHAVEDVTLLVRSVAEITEQHSSVLQGGQSTEIWLDSLLYSRELRETYATLQQQQAILRNTQSLVDAGSWQLDLRTNALEWAPNIYSIFGVAPNNFGHTLDSFLELVHPDDRDAFRLHQTQAVATDKQFNFIHRIIRPDGSTRTVREVAEVLVTPGGPVLTGVLQDVTRQLEAQDEARNAILLQRLAGRIGKFGGWRYGLQDSRILWSPETAAIHEEPEGKFPSPEQALSYYAPEYRPRLRAAYFQCIERGQPFDETLELITARGNRIWVRTTGEAVRDDKGHICAVHGSFQDVTELVRAREHAGELSRKLLDSLESISDGFLTLSRDWTITFVNTQAELMLERNRGELLGTPIWHAFPALAGSQFQTSMELACSTGRTERFTGLYAPAKKWFEVNAYPSQDGLAVHFRDVTAGRARDEHLRLLEAAVSRQNDILLITEAEPIDAPNGPRIVYVNDAFVRRTSYSREEAIGKTPRLLQGAKTQRAELDRIHEALRNWQPIRSELINYTKDGREFWLELDIVPIANEHGRYTHWVAAERDISERKKAEEVAALHEERFQLVATATNDVIRDWDMTNGKVWWNDGYLSLSGNYTIPVDCGVESWTGLIHADDRSRILSQLNQGILGGSSRWSEEYRCQRADGKIIQIIDRGFFLRDRSGKAVRMIGSMMDVTERRELDEKLRQSQKLEAVGQLTGGVAHDFNNLLTVIVGNSELLREELETTPRLWHLANMTVTAAERGAELTNRLLAFARRQPLQPKVLNLNKLLGGMDALLRRTLAENIDIRTVRGAGVGLTEVDPGQLEVAILNLAINARDAMPEGGRLTIETSNVTLDDQYSWQHHDVRPGDYVMISVSDTGTGMPPEVVARAFDPFFTTKEVGKGSGLGLSLVYGFVKQSGGHAKIYSEPGEGTTVKLYLPRVREGQFAAEDDIRRTSVQGGSEHIFVVEDDELVRTHLVNQLKALGYRVSMAENGKKALDLLHRLDDVDLLFTDIVMPGGMNGRELAESASAIRPGLKILFTSGYTENAVVHQGRLIQGVQLLSKPYRLQEMSAKVRKVLGGS